MGYEATAGPLPNSLSDLLPIPVLSELECPKTGAEPRSGDSPHEIEGLVGGATLNYTQALGNFKAALEGSVSPKAMNALDASAVAKDPVAATGVAVIALAAQKPLATVAYAIKAHETTPTEPVFLANLSGVANYFGLHREALAFAQKAETLPKKLPAFQRAVLLSNKGYALNSLGRPKEAEALLAEAIRLEPDFSEAYTNHAYSLGDQDKCPQAIRYLRAGKTRRPAAVLKMTGKGSGTEETPTRLPVSQVIDLSRGKPGVLPLVPIATEPGQAAAVRKQLDSFKEQTQPPTRQFQEQGPPLMQAIIARRMQWAEQGQSGVLTAFFAEALLQFLQEYTVEIIVFHQAWLGSTEPGSEEPLHPDPELRDLTKPVAHGHERLTKIIDDQDSRIWPERYPPIIKEYNEAMKRCEKSRDPNSCGSLAFLKKNTAICTLGKELAAQREPRIRAYDRALRDLYAESFRRASAMAAYFSDPSHKKWSQLALAQYAAVSFDRLVNGGYLMVDILERVKDNCEAANYTPMDVLFARLKQMADDCEASSKAKASFEVLEITANCEQIEIGVSTPGEVGLFAQVSYEFSQRYARIKDPKERFLEKQAGRNPDVKLNLPGYDQAFDGKLTVFAGGQAKVSAPGGVAEVGVKAGGTTTFDGNGDIVSSGGKFEVSGTAQAGAGGAAVGTETDLTPMFAPSFGGDG
jgi:tetratricopeptide (TPR) repeat protein